MQRGFTLVELVISAGLLLMLAVLFTTALLYGQESTEIAGQRTRAVFIANEGIEASRAIRDKSFAGLVNGTYGIGTTTGTWAFAGTSDTQDIFTRSVAIATVDSVTKQVTSTVTWPENALRTGTVSIVSYLTNTQLLSAQANSLTVVTSGAGLTGSAKNLSGITLQDVGSGTVTITGITTSWQTTSSVLQNIVINGTTVWSTTGPGTPTGSVSSGTKITTQSFALASGGAAVPITRFQFSGAMSGNSFTIVFTLSDGSTKTVTTSSL